MLNKKAIDSQVAAALRNLLNGQQAPRTNQPVAVSPRRNVLQQTAAFGVTRTTEASGGGDMAARMGFIKAAHKPLRSDLSMSDIAAQRSDRIPGQFSCVECGIRINLQESWRKPSDMCSNTSTLFCQVCALKLNQSAELGLAPIQLSNFDLLNMGQRVAAFDPPPTAQAAEPLRESKINKWKKILD